MKEPKWSLVFKEIWGEAGYPFYDLDKVIRACELYNANTYTEDEVKELIFRYVSEKAGFVPTKLKNVIDKWVENHKKK